VGSERSAASAGVAGEIEGWAEPPEGRLSSKINYDAPRRDARGELFGTKLNRWNARKQKVRTKPMAPHAARSCPFWNTSAGSAHPSGI
jgi:hypothetical protein